MSNCLRCGTPLEPFQYEYCNSCGKPAKGTTKPFQVSFSLCRQMNHGDDDALYQEFIEGIERTCPPIQKKTAGPIKTKHKNANSSSHIILDLGPSRRWEEFSVVSPTFDVFKCGHIWDWEHARRTTVLLNNYGTGDIIVNSVFIQEKTGCYSALTTTGLQVVFEDKKLSKLVTLFAIDEQRLCQYFPTCTTKNMRDRVNRNIKLLRELGLK